MADTSSSHRIMVCTSCRHTGAACKPGHELVQRLNTALAAAGDTLAENFEISGSVCMAGCSRPCTVAFCARAKTTYLFGDIGDDADIPALISFAALYAERADGMSREGERPAQLAGKTLARIPAALIITAASKEALQ